MESPIVDPPLKDTLDSLEVNICVDLVVHSTNTILTSDKMLNQRCLQ